MSVMPFSLHWSLIDSKKFTCFANINFTWLIAQGTCSFLHKTSFIQNCAKHKSICTWIRLLDLCSMQSDSSKETDSSNWCSSKMSCHKIFQWYNTQIDTYVRVTWVPYSYVNRQIYGHKKYCLIYIGSFRYNERECKKFIDNSILYDSKINYSNKKFLHYFLQYFDLLLISSFPVKIMKKNW